MTYAITDIARTPSGWRYTLAAPPYGIGWDVWLDGQLIARDAKGCYDLSCDTLYPPPIEVVAPLLSGNIFKAASMVAGNTALLSWAAPAGAKEYLIEHSSDGVTWTRLQTHAHSGGVRQQLMIRDIRDDAERQYRVTPGAMQGDIFFATGDPIVVAAYRGSIPEPPVVAHTYSAGTITISETHVEGEL